MKRICFIVSGFAYSGAEVVLERYIKENKDIKPEFIVIYDKKDVVDRLRDVYGSECVKCLYLRHNKHILRIAPMYEARIIKNKIGDMIQSIKPDIIYVNNTMEAMLLNKYIKSTNIPTVAHIHDMKKSIKSIIRREYTQHVLKQYDKVIMVSEATKIQWNIKDSLVVYNGLDKNYFNNKEKEYNFIKNIGIVGTMSKRKGTDLIIGSVDELMKMDINIHFIYNHGESKLIQAIQNKQKKYSKNIFIYNNLNQEQLKKIYDNMDIVLVPSRQDPLPTVVIEAMARKTIAIGTNIDGIPEMIKDSRLLIDPNSKESIVSKINEVKHYSCDKLKDLSNNQFEYCKKIFNSSNKNEKVNRILNELLK